MPFHGQIGSLRKANALIGSFDRAQHRDAAVLVRIDADAEIDLLGSRIGLEGVVEGQDRVAREGFHMSKQ